MKVFVTGGAGFIGSHIVDLLIQNDFEVIVIDNLSTGKKSNIHERAKFYLADITSDSLVEIFDKERPQYVIHQAAQTSVQASVKNPVHDANQNIIGTLNLLECCKKYNVQKILYASSAAVYGEPKYLGIDEDHPIHPLSFYGISKYVPEQYFQTYQELFGLSYVILRYSNVYGIRQDPKGEGGVVSIFVDKLVKQERPIIFGDGEQTRDFIYVADVAAANLAALLHGENDVFNISCNTPTSINTLLSHMNQIANTDLTPIYEAERQGDIKHSYLNNQKAIQKLDWKPKYSLSQGLEMTIRFYRDQKQRFES